MTGPGCDLWDLAGAERAVDALRRMVAEERVPHALLLSGPAHVGKHRLALELACALNHDPAQPSASDPSRCRPCARIRSGKHADVETVAPGGITLDANTDNPDSRQISIAQVRRLEMVAASHPYEGRRRVFIVDPADRMNDDAADAFLKTLEEPAPFVHFVLVTSRPALLKETIHSRCTRLEVAPMRVDALADWLASAHELPADRARSLARMARGRPGWAIAALADGDPFAVRDGQVEEIRRLPEQSRAERFQLAEGLASPVGMEPVNALTAVDQWTAWWHDVLLVANGSEESVVHAAHLEALRETAAHHRPAGIVRFLLALHAAERQLNEGVPSRNVLDVLLTQIPAPNGRSAARPPAPQKASV